MARVVSAERLGWLRGEFQKRADEVFGRIAAAFPGLRS